MPPKLRLPLFLTLIALAIRVSLCLVVLQARVMPQADEVEYLASAHGWADVIKTLALGLVPEHGARMAAWHNGTWPPVHAFLLSWGVLAGGLAGARLLLAVLGGLTTLFVWRLTRVLAGRRAAVAASLVFALYPSFVAFSHLLWSETTALFFLGAFLCLLVTEEGKAPDVRMKGALTLGALGGVCVLTREALLPIVAVALIWQFFQTPRDHRLRRGIVPILVAACVVIPWSIGTSILQGRPALLSNSGGMNLYLGNNPLTPVSLGSAWGVPPLKTEVVQRAIDVAGGQGPHLDTVAARLARTEMLHHPLRTLERMVVRLSQLWSIDFFPLRHLAGARYPPVRPRTFLLLTACFWASLSLVLLFGGIGMALEPALRHRGLLIWMLLAGMAGPLLSVSMSRLQLPLIFILLPAVGVGFCRFNLVLRRRKWAVAGLAVVAVLLPGLSVRKIVAWELEPSSYYAGALSSVSDLLDVQPLYTDLWACYSDGSRKHITPTLAGRAQRLVVLLDGPGVVRFMTLGVGAREPLAPSIGLNSEMRTLRPSQTNWRSWSDTSMPGVQCVWEGAAHTKDWAESVMRSPSGPRLHQP